MSKFWSHMLVIPLPLTVWETISNVVISFTVSLFMVICVELPFRQLAKQYSLRKNNEANTKY
ncbi:hypothetical protein X777_04825 [Ooceraea biroi]|uniref:Uncharacterized protein n=1 Tax=Ooceraea biroi TaxID=2015173 RepID=A0A026WHX4_OOCBI|nr:hypothetical protein X777_04825 [Ooceraea biroi]